MLFMPLIGNFRFEHDGGWENRGSDLTQPSQPADLSFRRRLQLEGPTAAVSTMGWTKMSGLMMWSRLCSNYSSRYKFSTAAAMIVASRGCCVLSATGGSYVILVKDIHQLMVSLQTHQPVHKRRIEIAIEHSLSL